MRFLRTQAAGGSHGPTSQSENGALLRDYVASETFHRVVVGEATAERSQAVWKLPDLVEQNADEIARLEAASCHCA